MTGQGDTTRDPVVTATIHRSKVGTYHPAPPSGPWHSAASCTICGWKGQVHDGPRLDIIKASKADAAAHPCYCDRTKERAITSTWQDRISGDPVAWTVNDTRGTIDSGPSCDECGACDCCAPEDGTIDSIHEDGECIGLSFAFVCLDGGELLCSSFAERQGIVIVECDCP